MMANPPDLSGGLWRKSSYSANGANCVEIASNLPGVVAVRDSKDRLGSALVLALDEWRQFVDGVRANKFDL
jgi:Domain of unknown function (DUF397)